MNIKALLLALLLAPASVFATIVGDDNTPNGNGHDGTPYLVNLGVTTQTILAGKNEGITDFWMVTLAESGKLDISFASSSINIINVAITDFKVSKDGVVDDDGMFSMDLVAGTYKFFVEGLAGAGLDIPGLGQGGLGGIYTVSTVFTAGDVVIPVPAAVWFMGTAMLGLLTVGRRKGA
jgi:hypothetical protein